MYYWKKHTQKQKFRMSELKEIDLRIKLSPNIRKTSKTSKFNIV